MTSLARIPACFSDRQTDDSLTPGTYDGRIDSTPLSWPASPGLVPLVVEILASRSSHLHPTLEAHIHAHSLQEVVVDRSFRFPAPPRARAEEPPPSKPASNEATKPATKEAAKAEAKAEPAKALTDPIDRIKDEGLNRSQLMATLSYLTDVIGPRLTGSPNLKRASEWTCQTLTKWGLANAHLEAWGPFGKGWTLKRFSAQVIEPQCIPLIAFPKAWSPSTDGALAAQVVYFDAKSEADFAKFKGKVKGAIVLTGPPREVSAGLEPLANRRTDKELLDLANAGEPSPSRFGRGGQPGNRNPSQNPNQGGPRDRAPGSGPASAQPSPRRNRFGPEMRAQMELARKKSKFLADEGAALLVDCSAQGDGGTLFVAGASVPGAAFPMPGQAPSARGVSAWDKDAPRSHPRSSSPRSTITAWYA